MNKFKETYILKEGSWKDIIKKISNNFGLPEVCSSMGMYFVDGDNNYELKFINSDCYFKAKNSTSDVDKKLTDLFGDTPQVHIENRNIKFFLRSLHTLGLSTAYFSGKVINIKFRDSGVEVVDFNLSTPIGDMLIIKDQRVNKYFKNKNVNKKLESKDIEDMFKEAVKSEPIFNSMNILNNKIVKYASDFGIDLNSSGQSSIETRLGAKSNNYSDYDLVYESIFNTNLSACGVKKDLSKFFRPVSIIIPSFDSSDTLLEVLYSIESQDIDKKQKSALDVIVVDDGSKDSVSGLLQKNKFSFEPNVVRLERNAGLSNSRNLGISLAKHGNLLFIDSDILLTKNYLQEHSIALQMFPNSLFISMKKNINPDAKMCEIKNIQKGLDIPESFSDKRLSKVFEKNQSWINEVRADEVCEVFSETDCLKLFGNGKHLGGYDLPSMVVGHNMSANKKLVTRAGGFSSNFVGWGVEDAYFGSRIIASGGFIIPLLNTGVYHIDHGPRSGNEAKRIREYKKNLETYKKLIRENI